MLALFKHRHHLRHERLQLLRQALEKSDQLIPLPEAELREVGWTLHRKQLSLTIELQTLTEHR